MSINEWTLDGFVAHFDFVHHKMLDHKFVWILGAGASYASGIPLGNQLVDRWLEEMRLREDHEDRILEEWATSERLGIKDFKFANRASFYSHIYQRRFKDYPDEGYAYLESVMSRIDPSPGYSILAAALAFDPPRHNVVITTNFDNLVADALSIYTDTFPFVAGHESLTGFVRVSMRRPLICKIHRDLLLGPQNDTRSLKRLHDAWGTALRSLFQHYTPIVIGYGGNDDTLMDLMGSLQPHDIKGQLIWCYYEGKEPSSQIVDVVTELHGVLVPVPDFDLLMVLLGEKMGISTLDEEIGVRAQARTQRYRGRIQQMNTVDYPSVTKALASTFERSGGWWVWLQKADLETDPIRREVVFRQGLHHCPASADLHAAFAEFIFFERKNLTEVEQLYQQALKLEPKNSHVLTRWARFLSDGKGDFEEAEKVFRLALKIDATSFVLSSFAYFLGNQLERFDEAEQFFQRAIQLERHQPFLYSGYANILLGQGKLKEAEENIALGRAANVQRDAGLDASLSFYSAIVKRSQSQDDKPDLEALKVSFSKDITKGLTNPKRILQFVEKTLPPEDHHFFIEVAKGFSLGEKIPDIDALLKERAASQGNSETTAFRVLPEDIIGDGLSTKAD
ncbi:MAG TPA: SIR2 family protein [Pyrinomonadaceae bacterium]|nr:SIR2 family protein [Pyrinomonadaceae bacterium]